jgi:DNA mismatch repair protein MutS2
MKLSAFTESKLGFDQIRQFLEGKAASPEARQFIAELQPSTDVAALREELSRVREAQTLIETGKELEAALPYSVRPMLDRSRISGNWLAGDELARMLRWLRMVRAMLRQLKEHQLLAPNLWIMVAAAEFNPKLIPQIETVVDDQGNIKDSASPQLRSLRSEQTRVSADLRKVLSKILRHARNEGWAGDAEITMRNDRLVIPINSDFRGRVSGFEHDVSQSGQTIFLEPAESLEMNNHLRRLQAQEKNEITRILVEVTRQVGENAELLEHFVWLMGRIDFIRAKALLAVAIQASLPVIVPMEENGFILIQARHPLLVLRNKDNAVIVPISLEFNSDRRIILISGPNAGGKSVTMKTVGLLQLMVQCGLLVSAKEGTTFQIFDKIFVDIGDEQSIQNDLSTYTSHLKMMREMIDGLDSRSMFLIDEFGAGTDPRLGGAIAEAFLEKFLASHAFGVVTTHYGNLKQFGEAREGIVNAAMHFNPETLSPTFEIEVGNPGRSYAFEIARKVGVAESIISCAREKVDARELYADDLLLKLESQKAELDIILTENRRNNEELKTLLEKNRALAKQLQEKRTAILKEARDEAQHLIMQANARIERTIKEIRETSAEKQLTKNLRKELSEMVSLTEEKPAPPELLEIGEEPPVELPDVEIQEGDWVKLKEGDTYGYVEELNGKRAIMVAGQMRLTVNVSSLVKIEAPKPEKPIAGSNAQMVNEKRSNASAEIDVQGMRVDEALITITKFMDDALLAGLTELRILHGKGTGALRIAIREYLRKHYAQVKSLEDGPADFGGPGWTIVNMLIN